MLLPATSKAVHVTVVTPLEKEEPLGGAQPTLAKPQLSVAVAVKVIFEAEHWPGSVERTIFAGQAIAGG